jgi:purine-binding chemotaxis protein CheW
VAFLVILVGRQPYALRISELAGLAVDRKTVPLPIDAPGFLGLCAVHGELVPVFQLAALLGAPPAQTPGRWLALHRDTELVALAFDGLRETRRVMIHEIRPAAPSPRAHASREAITVDSRVIHVIDIPSVIAVIRGGGMHRR